MTHCLGKLIDVKTEKHLSILHLNTRSLPGNFDKVTNLLSTLNLNFSMIGISETWLKDSFHSCDIPGYNFIHEPRRSRTGGGVGLYLNQDFQFKCRPEIRFSDSCAESLFVEIIRQKERNIIVGVIYRPPEKNVLEFCDELDQLLMTISANNKLCVLLGDWNLDIMKHDRHSSTAEFLDIMYSKMFFPLITRPTRITSYTTTLLDNIFINSLDSFCASGVLFSDVSDHLPVFTFLSEKMNVEDKKTWITYREKSAINMARFRTELQQHSWENIADDNPCNAYSNFLQAFSSLFNNCFPIKKVTTKKTVIMKPWLTKGLLKSIKKKNALYKQFLSSPTVSHKRQYKCFRNKLIIIYLE